MSTDIPCILNIMANMGNSYCLQTTPLDGAMYIKKKKKKIAGEDKSGYVTQFQFLTQQWCQLSHLLSPHWNSLIKIGDPVVIIGKFRAVDEKLFRLEETDVTEHDISSANALCNLNTRYIPRLTEAHWSDTSSLSEAFELKKVNHNDVCQREGQFNKFLKGIISPRLIPKQYAKSGKKTVVSNGGKNLNSICHRLRARKILSCLHIRAIILVCASDIFLKLIIVSDLKSEIFQLVAVITDIAVF